MALAVGWLALGTPAPMHGQTTASTWEAAVDAYLEGRDHEATAVLQLSQEHVKNHARAALAAWIARAKHAEGTLAARTEHRLMLRRVQAAAVLPLELLIRLSARLRVVSDVAGYEFAAIEAWEQLADAEKLALEYLDTPGRKAAAAERLALQRFRAAWQVGWLQYLLNTGRYGDFTKQAAMLRLEHVPPALQAEFHVIDGYRLETTSRSQAPVRRLASSDPQTPAGGLPSSRLRLVQQSLEQAERAFGRALEQAPDHLEARLHYGRVALDRGRPADAIDRLAPLRREPCLTVWCGLATLFTGEAHEQRGAPGNASRAYSMASSVPDVRQSALLALMHLAVQRGDAGGAGLVTHFMHETPLGRTDRPDAWSVYLSGQRTQVDAIVQLVREAILR